MLLVFALMVCLLVVVVCLWYFAVSVFCMLSLLVCFDAVAVVACFVCLLFLICGFCCDCCLFVCLFVLVWWFASIFIRRVLVVVGYCVCYWFYVVLRVCMFGGFGLRAFVLVCC